MPLLHIKVSGLNKITDEIYLKQQLDAFVSSVIIERKPAHKLQKGENESYIK